MELLEYQAKKLFRQVGIPVLPSETIANPKALKQLQIPYPVVLKSQVRAGGRGKAGGVKFVTNTIDAIAVARNIFNLSILGEYPEVILAEARYNARQELFLSIVLDYDLQCPVIFGSCSGGMNVNLLLENLQQIAIEREFFPFLARRLTVMMGLSGDLLLSVSEIIEKMYRLFRAHDLDFIEINPLAVGEGGQLMALDGKITVGDGSFPRDLESLDLTIKKNRADANSEITQLEKSGIRWLNWLNRQGKIALVTNNNELAILIWDLLSQQKAHPACAVIIDSVSSQEQILRQQLQQILAQLQSQNSIRVLLINLWETEVVNQAIAQALFTLCTQPTASPTAGAGEDRAIVPTNSFRLHPSTTKSPSIAPSKVSPTDIESVDGRSRSVSASPRSQFPPIKFVIRLAQQDIESYQLKYAHEALVWVNNLEDAISEAIYGS